MGAKQANNLDTEEFRIEKEDYFESENPEFIDCPDYDLEEAKMLPEITQKEITWLLVQFKGRNNPLTEEVEGYLKVLKKNRYGIKESRWILFTTHSLYVVESGGFTELNTRICLDDIDYLGYSLDNKVFAIKTKGENAKLFIYYSEKSVSAVNAIKTMYYLKNKDFIYIIIEETAKELQNNMENSIEIENPDFKTFNSIGNEQNIKNRLEYLITSVELFEVKPEISKSKLFISNFSLYFITKSKKNIIILIQNIKILLILPNHLEFVIKSKFGDLWLIHSQAYSILQEISEAYQKNFEEPLKIRFINQKGFKFQRITIN